MLAVSGMFSQELCNHKTIMATVDFYQKVYSGINPYEDMPIENMSPIEAMPPLEGHIVKVGG